MGGLEPRTSPPTSYSLTKVVVGLPETVRFDMFDGRPALDERGRSEILDGELEEPANWWRGATFRFLRQKHLSAPARFPGGALSFRTSDVGLAHADA